MTPRNHAAYEHGQCIECEETATWHDGNVLSCGSCGGEWEAELVGEDDADYVRFENAETGEIDAVVELEDRV